MTHGTDAEIQRTATETKGSDDETIGTDLVVIGGGLAGAMAAAGATSRGAEVTVVRGGESSLRSATGCIDLLGFESAAGPPVSHPIEAISSMVEAHPYRRLGQGRIREGLAFFDEMTEDRYAGGRTGANALFPTQLGTVKPTSRYPTSFAPGSLSRPGDMLLCSIQEIPGFDASFAAQQLRTYDVPFDVRGVSMSLGAAFAVENPGLRIGRALDRNERLREDVPIRDRLAREVSKRIDDEERVGFPPILGRDSTDEVREDLTDILGVPVFEIPGTPPSLPGIRLSAHLDRTLREAGVVVREGTTIHSFEENDGRVTGLRTEGGDRSVRLEASEYVLATGGLVGGGINPIDGAVEEPIFDLPVRLPESSEQSMPGKLADHDPLGPHEFARLGLEIDSELRPLHGRSPRFSNLRAAGAVLGGFDPTVEHSGSGVAITTGYWAGRLAAGGES
ncbi:MAG: glycerol-3-phosphate dehydrogenase subunit GlpB [Halanaeroarchaeum sp.]